MPWPDGDRCESAYVRGVKPTADFIVAVMVGLLLLPVVAVTAGAVLVTMGRPVLYRQVRVGRNGQHFHILKFRTMTQDRRTVEIPFEGPERRLSYEATDDPRHTNVGRWLRAWSLDELPQLWNVVRGDMSLVGPRPEVPPVVRLYLPWQNERHRVKPGITGLWQVTARNVKPMEANVGIDVDYVRRISFGLDCWILARTLPTVFLDGAALGKPASSPESTT